MCKKGQPSVAVKIEMGGHQPAYGRQLEEKDTLYSLSIDRTRDKKYLIAQSESRQDLTSRIARYWRAEG